MIALHFENLLFILVVAVAFLFQLLTRVASRASKDSGKTKPTSSSPPRTPPPIARAKPPSDQERIREFLEALGQPTTSKPPAPVAPRPTYRKPVVLPRVRPFGSPLPPLTTRPPDLPREIRLPGQIRPTRQAKVFTPKATEAPAFEVREGQTALEPPPPAVRTAAEAYAIASQPTTPPPRAEANIATLLRSTSGLRDAMILREIFGPPRSLQPLDLIGTV
jgi:hypothetical protein